VGVANYPDHAVHSDELIAVADAAMYRAKNAGKNCVCGAGSQPNELTTT
jgi:GGDEF domain-containing protein